MRYEMTSLALDRIGKIWVKVMRDKIREKGKVASGNLLKSISYRVVMLEGKPTLEITYADYITYVNRGRLPRGEDRPIEASNGAVPIPALVKWIKQKGLSGAKKRGRTSQSTLSLAFAIRASIWKYGIAPYGKGSLLFDPTLDEVYEMLNPVNIPNDTPEQLRYELNEIWEAMYDDFNVLIENMIDNLIKVK